jgi:glutamate synthase (NADPH/NADH) large chain
MSGGVAFVHDPDGQLPLNINDEMADLEHLEAADQETLRALLERHRDLTGSDVAARILAGWNMEISRFRKVMPRDYKRVLAVLADARAAGLDEEATAAKVMESVNG